MDLFMGQTDVCNTFWDFWLPLRFLLLLTALYHNLNVLIISNFKQINFPQTTKKQWNSLIFNALVNFNLNTSLRINSIYKINSTTFHLLVFLVIQGRRTHFRNWSVRTDVVVIVVVVFWWTLFTRYLINKVLPFSTRNVSKNKTAVM